MRLLIHILIGVFALWSAPAYAQTDEIQVYDAEIAEPGVVNLMLHNNYTPIGLNTPRFPGGLVPNRTLNGVAEWAVGVTPWFEQGFYMPLYSLSSNDGAVFNGFKIRELFVVPNAAKQTFFYGINFEFSMNSAHWDERHYTNEIRPIIGWHLGKFDFIINPILDNPFQGFGNLEFAPSTRLAYNISEKWAVAIEEYADIGPLRHFNSFNEQSHQIFGVVNYKTDEFEIEAGLGVGITPASDKLVAKLMISRDLYKPAKEAKPEPRTR